jgi:hypothetical protein
LRESENISLTITNAKSRVNFVMLIVRQPSRLATKAAFAACRGRLFDGLGYSAQQDRQESSKTMPNTDIAHVWRAG